MAVDELDEATALARWDLDVGDLSESLEEGSELILSDVARKPAHEDGRVVRVGELVHLGGRIVAAVRETLHSTPHGLLRNTSHHGTATVRARASEAVITTVLGSSSRDSHRSVTAVNTLHLNQGTLLIVLVGEAHKAIASALAGHGIRHDLGRLARWEAGLEKRDQDVFVDLRAEVTHKDAVLGSTVITSIHKTAARRPVKLELARAVGNRCAVKTKCLGSSFRGGEFNEAVAGVARVLVANHVDVDSLSGSRQKNALNEILVHPRLQLSHPESGLGLFGATRRRGHSGHVRSRRGSVRERHFAINE